jgi:anti-sigma B factor antagonist
MLDITVGANDEVVLAGRFDAAQAEKAESFFLSLPEGKVVDFSQLTYISSAGLGVLLEAQKRLKEKGRPGLRLVNANSHIREIFRFTGFDKIFDLG